jgi:hypothetical protein
MRRTGTSNPNFKLHHSESTNTQKSICRNRKKIQEALSEKADYPPHNKSTHNQRNIS